MWKIRINYTPETEPLPIRLRTIDPLSPSVMQGLKQVAVPLSGARQGDPLGFGFHARPEGASVRFDDSIDVIEARANLESGLPSRPLKYRRDLLPTCGPVGLAMLSDLGHKHQLLDDLEAAAAPLLEKASESFGYEILVTPSGLIAIPCISQVRGYQEMGLRPQDHVLLYAFGDLSNHSRLSAAQDIGRVACRCSPFLLAYEITEEWKCPAPALTPV